MNEIWTHGFQATSQHVTYNTKPTPRWLEYNWLYISADCPEAEKTAPGARTQPLKNGFWQG